MQRLSFSTFVIKILIISLILIIMFIPDLDTQENIFAQDTEMNIVEQINALTGIEKTEFANLLVVEIDSNNARDIHIYEALILFYYQRRIFGSVIDYGIKSLEIQKNPGIAYYMARVFHLQTGEFRKAIKAYEIVNETRDNGTYLPDIGTRDEVFYYMGLCYEELEKYYLAQSSYLAAKIFSTEENYYYNLQLATVLAKLNEWEWANTEIEEALLINPDCLECLQLYNSIQPYLVREPLEEDQLENFPNQE